ncbi:unnamed protein product [Rotaria socialis]|uniref:Uncharacterized protein n=1 Tax=Rotaria socialis TaxID=392032 RepID=A0A821EUK6_9BILA|nr:unnamed protein product [Rotaria socialis]CAF4641143.1 unnamed protein product [Rotaria socialis]
MATSFKKKSNSTVEVLSELVEDPSANENDKAKYIINVFILILKTKIGLVNVIEDINNYQQITKSKKLELLKIKSELQQSCHKSRMILMELTNNDDTDDDDEYAQFFFL